MKLFTLILASSVVLCLSPIFEDSEFLLRGFMIIPHMCFVLSSFWALELEFYVLPSNLFCWALVLVNAFIKGEIMRAS